MREGLAIRVLVVDDSPTFLDTAVRWLAEVLPHLKVVGCCSSGVEALRQVETLRPDLVLMDLALPEMDGLEATRRLKQRPRAPYVIILTLHDIPEYRLAAQEAHADGFISKVNFSTQLPSLIASLFGDVAPEPTEQASDMRNILIVDDSATMRRMIMACLRDLGHISFEQASSGLEAIERLTLQPLDLVVLDLNMPDMHGLELLRFIRNHEAYKHLPVVVVTTRGDENSQADALAAGASAYLTKPFEPRILRETVRQYLGAKRP